MKCLLVAVAGMFCSSAVLAEPVAILFVGNSYTFGRVDPVERPPTRAAASLRF